MPPGSLTCCFPLPADLPACAPWLAAAAIVMATSCSLAVLVNVSQFMCLGRFSAVSFQVGACAGCCGSRVEAGEQHTLVLNNGAGHPMPAWLPQYASLRCT